MYKTEGAHQRKLAANLWFRPLFRKSSADLQAQQTLKDLKLAQNQMKAGGISLEKYQEIERQRDEAKERMQKFTEQLQKTQQVAKIKRSLGF